MDLSKDDIIEKVSTRIEQARSDVRGMSQAELARRTGVSASAILRWEKGANQVPIHQLCKVSDALDLDLGYFLQDLSDNIKLGQKTEADWLPIDEAGDRAEMSVRLKDLVESVDACEIYVGVSQSKHPTERQVIRASS